VQNLKTSEKSMIREVKYRLERIMRKDRAGSIFNPAEEIAIEYILKELLGQDTSDVEKRIVEARKTQALWFSSKESTESGKVTN
jgi:hypothetical protein